MDGGNENLTMNLRKHYILAHNILDLFQQYNVPAEPDYVSIDLDTIDLWIFKAIISSSGAKRYRPRVITVEYNCLFPLPFAVTYQPEWTPWQSNRAYGCSLAALRTVAADYGYALVALEPCLDAFFVRADLVEGCQLASWETIARYTGLHLLHKAATPDQLNPMLDYYVYSATNNVSTAKEAFLEQLGYIKSSWGFDYWSPFPIHYGVPYPRVE